MADDDLYGDIGLDSVPVDVPEEAKPEATTLAGTEDESRSELSAVKAPVQRKEVTPTSTDAASAGDGTATEDKDDADVSAAPASAPENVSAPSSAGAHEAPIGQYEDPAIHNKIFVGGINWENERRWPSYVL